MKHLTSKRVTRIHPARIYLTVASLILLSVILARKIPQQPSTNVITIPPIQSKQLSIQCTWAFDHYAPSRWEAFWYDNITDLQSRVCQTLTEANQMNKTIRAVERVIQLQKSLSSAANLSNEDDLLFSKLFYRYDCSNGIKNTSAIAFQYIEPLVGLTRDPLTICSQDNVPSHLVLHGEEALQSKRFFLLGSSAPYMDHQSNSTPRIAPWLHQPGGRKILFDIGTSLYNGQDHPTDAGTAIGARWFVDYFRSISLQFDQIIAYESFGLEPAKYWEQIPEELMGRLVFINNQVNISGKFNPWNVLRSIVKKEDYVVVKLDIDTPDVEKALLEQVIRDSSISSLIDEMFFEMHVDVSEMVPYWGPQPGQLKDTYVMFTILRHLGIRMHSWP